jgi:hypothetical protein
MFKYERDDSARRVVITFEGPFQTSEALACIQRHRAEGVWHYGVLYDLRRMTGCPSIVELRQLMSEDLSGPGGPGRGPVAFLANDRNLYGKACTYGMLGGSKLRIEVFRDPGEADLWLATLTNRVLQC